MGCDDFELAYCRFKCWDCDIKCSTFGFYFQNFMVYLNFLIKLCVNNDLMAMKLRILGYL